MERKEQNVTFDEPKKDAGKSMGEVSASANGDSSAPTPHQRLHKRLFWSTWDRIRAWAEKLRHSKRTVIDPEGDVIFNWMALVAIAVAVNVWLIILRISFKELEDESVSCSIFNLIDTICDAVYLLDVVVNFRMGYLEQGLLVTDPVKLSQNYYNKRSFRLDLLCLMPLYMLVPPTDYFPVTALRLHRLLKMYALETFFAVWDSRTSNPNRHRATKLAFYLAGVIHWTGCIYFMVSKYEGFGSNEWVYPESVNTDSFSTKYIRVIYWSTVTLTTIGGTENPVTDLEHVFMVITFMVGVFIFATVMGNVGDVISNMNAARQEYQAKMDAIKFYMNHRQVPPQIQSRVKKWSNYAWSRTQALEDQEFLEFLPPRLRSEIATHVHLETLQKVKIFADCEEGFLRELVLRLRSQIYSPGDFICRRGEIGREMYIINHGKVQVVVTDAVTQERMVVATLSEGNYFGEISLLKLNEGQNRRTADVVSLGYSELLCLSKKDLMQALVEYPDAKDVLEKHGRDRVNQNKEATRLQRRKSESTISIPDGVRMLMKEKEKQSEQTGDRKTRTEKMWNKVYDKSMEWSELNKVIKTLRTFDSISTSKRMNDLELKCEDLTKKLAERDQQLLVAIRRFTELEELIGVHPMPKNGHNRPESHGQISSLVDDNKTTTSNRHQTVINTNSVFENRVRRIQDIFESHIKRIYTTESHLRTDHRTHSEVKSSIEERERKARIKRKRKSSKRFCNLSFSSDHSFTKTELTQVTSKENVTTTMLIPGIKINDVIMQTPYNWEPKCIVSGENSMTSHDIPAGRSGKTRELLKSKVEKSGSSRRRSTNADSYSSETSDVINNNGAESSSSHCMEIREMSILSISPRTSYVNSSADFTDASAYSDSSSDSDKYS